MINKSTDEDLETLRHSTGHLMAHAVLELFPETQTGIGPAVEDGFFYDFLRDKPFTLEDLSTIEKKMQELAQEDIPIQKLELPKEEALRLFQDMGQELKVELIQEKGDKKVTCYKQGSFVDFCLGPHIPSTGAIKHFKLLSVSGAYWKGDEKGNSFKGSTGLLSLRRKTWKIILICLKKLKKGITGSLALNWIFLVLTRIWELD